jgi:hypothetical protein
MLSIFLFAAILGGGLLLIGMIGGEADVGDAVDADLEIIAKGPGWKHAFSFQTVAYALAAFGLTGAVLTFIGVPAAPTLVAAGAMGLTAGTLVGLLFRWLKRSQGGFGETSDRYIGGVGRTEVRIPSGGRGRIELVHRGRAFTLPAVSAGGEIDRHEPVVIVDVVDGVAHVQRAPEELTF